MQFDRRHLDTLAAILRLGSFEAAARALGLTQSAVSQRLRALEEQIGTVLVQRETPCRGTEAGRRLAAHAETVALLERDVTTALGAARPDLARVRIAVNADSLASWFLAALEPVEGMLFDLVVDDESHAVDWLRRGEVMAAVCEHAAPVQGCDAHPLGVMRYLAVASPAYIDRWGLTGCPAPALARAPMLRFDARDDLQHRWLSRYVAQDLDPPSHALPSTQGFVEAALRGIGWGLNPDSLLRPHLERGDLVELKPDTPMDVTLTWQVSRMLAPSLDPLTRAVRRAARTVMRPGAPC